MTELRIVFNLNQWQRQIWWSHTALPNQLIMGYFYLEFTYFHGVFVLHIIIIMKQSNTNQRKIRVGYQLLIATFY